MGIVAVLFSMACNLSYGEIKVDTEQTPVSDDGGANPLPRCAPEDWVFVTIYSSESLEILAEDTGASTQEVLDANCLQSSTDVSPGEPIWLPAPPTRAGGTTVADPINMIGVNSGILTPGETVILSWRDVPDIVTAGEIAYFPANNDPALIQSIVYDDDVSDGISVEWTVPDDLDGYIVASARLGGQNHDFVTALELWVSTGP